VSRGNAGDNRDTKVSNDEGAHRKKLNYPLDKPHNLWYNEYSQEGGGNHDTRTALMKATSPIKIFKEI
jgi:hypothetical protein